ncbi:hypothetical protein NMG60_11028559 [Bertholletia excelsa]
MEGAGEEETEFNLSEWAVKARMVSMEKTRSRRFSAPNMRSLREDGSGRSFRSSITVSSTASSPGYLFREEIDPSSYSFTTALRELRERSLHGNKWEYRMSLSPEVFALNSKWDEAEKYISNPESGKVPVECLSAKTLSFRGLADRIAMSAPLYYTHRSRRLFAAAATTKDPSLPVIPHRLGVHSPIPEKKVTRDVGTQSTPPALSSDSPSPASTPPIQDRSIKRGEAEVEDSPLSHSSKLSFHQQEKVVVKETREEGAQRKELQEVERKRAKQVWRCLPWRILSLRERTRKTNQGRKRKGRGISLLSLLTGAE